jgi:hypothetical protein
MGIYCKKQTPHNNRYTLRRLSAARAPENRSRACALRCNALYGVLLTHIFAAQQNLRFRSFGLQKRRQPTTLCDSFANLLCSLGDEFSL